MWFFFFFVFPFCNLRKNIPIVLSFTLDLFIYSLFCPWRKSAAIWFLLYFIFLFYYLTRSRRKRIWRTKRKDSNLQCCRLKVIHSRDLSKKKKNRYTKNSLCWMSSNSICDFCYFSLSAFFFLFLFFSF